MPALPDKPGLQTQDAPCVLLVEDDPLAQIRYEQIIEAGGFIPVSVPSTEQARAALAAVCFPIVILDRMVEDGDSLTLCDELRKQRPFQALYLIVLSALDSAVDIACGYAAGANAYLSKQAAEDLLLEQLAFARREISKPAL